MPVPLDVLKNLLNTLRIDLTGPAQPAPGQAATAQIVPQLSNISVTEVLESTIGLTWLTKDIRFDTALIEPTLESVGLNGEILGGLPIGGFPALTGIPGLLGQLTGKLPVPSTSTVPISLEVEWSVTDQAGTALTLGTDFLAPNGLKNPSVSLFFAPATAELTTDDPLPEPVTRKLKARVRLTAGGTQTDFINLPEIPILVPVLPLPTLLALFLHSDFQARTGDDDGAVLLVVPANSPFGSLQQLQPTLNTLQEAASTLASFASFAGFVAGLSELTGALTAQPHVQFRSTNQIGNLNDITLIQRGFFENDTEAEDELSSLIFIGPQNKQAQLFNARNFDRDEGSFTLTIGSSLFVIVRTLHSDNPVAEGGTLEVDQEFQPDTFGDELSSLKFL
ncbi:MAG: hypothetical protein JOZ51_28035 [Chloroflexi bacterium]|nr:hypothetical protein [Chloroflexota bacterium]